MGEALQKPGPGAGTWRSPKYPSPAPFSLAPPATLGISCTPGPKAERGQTSDTFNITQWTNRGPGQELGF